MNLADLSIDTSISDISLIGKEEIINTPGSKTKICRFFVSGVCTRGDACKFRHDLLAKEMSVQLPKNSPKTSSRSRNRVQSCQRQEWTDSGSLSSGSGSDKGQKATGTINPSVTVPQPWAPVQHAWGSATPAIPVAVPYAGVASTIKSPAPTVYAREPPPPVYVNPPPGQPIFCIDVECVASTVQHTGRSVAQIALANEMGQPMLNMFIKQEGPVASYITELTGITKELLEANQVPFDQAMATLRYNLPKDSILVGFNILKDVQWLGLVEGKDFSHLIDLSALFRVWNVQRNEFTCFSQDHCAMVWLGIMDRISHDALTDAAISMYLFNAYRSTQYDAMRLAQLQHMTLHAPRVLGFSSRHPEIDGCCMGNRKTCKCGAPFL